MIQAIRGMNDILPNESFAWQWIEQVLKEVADQYGYQEIRFPILEYTSLFKRTIGEVTDIVEKEMYTFNDRNGDSLTLRPEGTACCVRAGIEHGLFYNQVQRLWYKGPMFRHERPQKGRYRQFYQFGAEVFGLKGPDIDAELILMSARLWKRLSIADHLTLRLNSLGTAETRGLYHKELLSYFSAHERDLDEDSQRRLHRNPMRILDSKNPAMQDLIKNAPRLIDRLDPDSQAHFDQLRGLLDAAGVRYEIDPCLVRGLDYYTKTVFEWTTDRLGAQGTLCAGGRFDSLVEQLGGQATPAIGFALGFERLLALMEAVQAFPIQALAPHVYLIYQGEAAEKHAFVLAETLKDELPALRLVLNMGGGTFKNQFKKADKSGAALALILGEEELAKGQIAAKLLREDKTQEIISLQSLTRYVQKFLEGSQ